MMAKQLWAMGLSDDAIWINLQGYNPDVNAALKSELPGPARWRKDKGRWEFPVHWDPCTGARRIANKFGADLRLAPALRDWAEAEKARQETIPDVQSMGLVDLESVRSLYPTLW